MTDKEKKFSDFEAGEIELGGDDLMKYLSSSYMKPNDVGSTVSKIIDREGLKALAKQLSIVKNTGSNTPEGDMIIKGLNSLIDAKLASLQTNPTGKYEEYIKNPWTRDAQVRTQVIQVATRITGMVTKIHVKVR